MITITSTTDSEEAVQSAMAGKTEEVKEETEVKTEESEASNSEVKAEEVAEESAEESEEKTEEKKSKEPTGYKKKLLKEREKAAKLEQELAYLRGKLDAKEPVKKSEEKAEKPSPENFETNAEYIDALTDWKLEQKLAQKEQESSKKSQQNEFQKTVETFQGRLSEFKETAEDFDEVVAEVDHLVLSGLSQEALISSDVGPQIMYELAKNPKELERIYKLSPVAQVREIGKIEAKLSASKETKTVTKSQAPAPVKPVSSKSATVVKDIYDPNLSFKEFEKLREKQLRGA